MQKDWAGAVPVRVERTKEIIEILRRQISKQNVERSLGESLGF